MAPHDGTMNAGMHACMHACMRMRMFCVWCMLMLICMSLYPHVVGMHVVRSFVYTYTGLGMYVSVLWTVVLQV